MKVFRGFAALALAGLMIVSSGRAQAATVQFLDLTETPTVTADSGPYAILGQGTQTPSVYYLNATNAPFTATYTFLDGSSGSAVSDYVLITGGGFAAGSLTIQFVSDTNPGENLIVPVATFNLGTTVETGAFQTVPLAQIAGLLTIPLTIQVQSENSEFVPEPASLTMAAMSGLVGLGVWGYRRRKAADV